MEVSFQLADVVEDAKKMKEYLKWYIDYIKYEMKHGYFVPSRDLVYFFEKIDKDKELLVIMDYNTVEKDYAGRTIAFGGGEICKILKVKKEVIGDPIDEDLLEELIDEYVLVERDDWDYFWSIFD
jgi:hypothetical protein